MTQIWQAEQSVDAQLATQLIERQFPSLAPARAEILGEGWDNTVFAVNDRWAFRFPRRAFAVPLLEAEARLLPHLAALLPLPIPLPRYHGVPSAAYPWPFLGHVLLPGRLAAQVGLDDAGRCALAQPLARFLRALHDIPLTLAEQCAVPMDEIARLDSGRRAMLTNERLTLLQARGLLTSRALFDLLLNARSAYTPSARQLIHGDLHSGQILLDGAGTLSGIIDWGDVHIGDPATDLAVVHTLLPPSAHAEFVAIYGAIPPLQWHAARVRATWHSVAVAAYALDIGDNARMADALRSLAFIAAGDG